MNIVEYPKSGEKLSYKFIRDSIYDGAAKEDVVEEERTVLKTPPQTQVETFVNPEEPITLQEKKYFRIGEVSELLKVEPYVLRYWESEFPNVKPSKSVSGHRVYSRKDVEFLIEIKKLLYTDKFSLKGAKQKLRESFREQPNPQHTLRKEYEQSLKYLGKELKELIRVIKNTPGL